MSKNLDCKYGLSLWLFSAFLTLSVVGFSIYFLSHGGVSSNETTLNDSQQKQIRFYEQILFFDEEREVERNSYFSHSSFLDKEVEPQKCFNCKDVRRIFGSGCKEEDKRALIEPEFKQLRCEAIKEEERERMITFRVPEEKERKETRKTERCVNCKDLYEATSLLCGNVESILPLLENSEKQLLGRNTNIYNSHEHSIQFKLFSQDIESCNDCMKIYKSLSLYCLGEITELLSLPFPPYQFDGK